MNYSPIGIFDSGIGGLTVFKEISSKLPHEDLIYLGDTARVPYGSRSKETIINYSLELVQFLLKQKVKILVVACNTISSTALEEIKKISPVPVIEVINPTINQALEISKTKHIGVIGTEATIRSNIYPRLIHQQEKRALVSSLACPLLVPLIEEGLLKNKGTEEIMQLYLRKFKDKKMDTLILGCTHYPILKNLIKKSLPNKTIIVDSAIPTANAVRRTLKENNLLNQNKKIGERIFYVTDDPQKAGSIAKIFLKWDYKSKFKKITLVMGTD